MRKLLLSILSFGLIATASAQTINILNEDDSWAVSNGQHFTVSGTQFDLYIDVNYEVVNLTANPIEFKYRRVRLAHTVGFTDQVCDSVLCLDADDAYQYDRPASYMIDAYDSTDFLVKLAPNQNRGCAIYRYYIMDDANNIYDSVTVTYEVEESCFLSTNEQKEIEYNAYPNPATDIFNIDMTTNGNSVSVVLYNVLGERVKSQVLVDGTNTVSLDGLNNGVYFYSINRNGEVVETKKIVVRK